MVTLDRGKIHLMRSAFSISMIAALVLLLSGEAWADSVVTTGNAPRNHLNLRVGASSSDQNGHPSLCMEVSPLSSFSVEGCGTGSGFLHSSPAPELAHFRGKWRVASIQNERGWLQPYLSAGFAELQVAEDDPGFDFRGTGREGVETAGPEVGASLRLLVPMSRGTEFLGEIAVGAAYLRHAPDLIKPNEPWQVSASFTAGFGF